MILLRRAAALAAISGSIIACSSPAPTSTSAPRTTPSTSALEQPAATFVAGFCTAFAHYMSKTQALPEATGSDIRSTRQSLVAFFESEILATKNLLTEIKALGTPAVPDGANISSDLIQSFTTLETRIRSLPQKAASFPMSSEAAFERSFNRLFKEFGRDSKNSLVAVGQIRDDPQLLAAFNSSPECASLIAGSPVQSIPGSVVPSTPG